MYFKKQENRSSKRRTALIGASTKTTVQPTEGNRYNYRISGEQFKLITSPLTLPDANVYLLIPTRQHTATRGLNQQPLQSEPQIRETIRDNNLKSGACNEWFAHSRLFCIFTSSRLFCLWIPALLFHPICDEYQNNADDERYQPDEGDEKAEGSCNVEANGWWRRYLVVGLQ